MEVGRRLHPRVELVDHHLDRARVVGAAHLDAADASDLDPADQLLVRMRDHGRGAGSCRLGPEEQVAWPRPIRGLELVVEALAIAHQAAEETQPVTHVERSAPVVPRHHLELEGARLALTRQIHVHRHARAQREPAGGARGGEREPRPAARHGHFELVTVSLVEHRHVPLRRDRGELVQHARHREPQRGGHRHVELEDHRSVSVDAPADQLDHGGIGALEHPREALTQDVGG